jgi:hypothetical protein
MPLPFNFENAGRLHAPGVSLPIASGLSPLGSERSPSPAYYSQILLYSWAEFISVTLYARESTPV